MIVPNHGVLETVTPTVVQSAVTSSTYPYLLATVTAPASGLGDVVYDLEIDQGAGWQPAVPLWAGQVQLRNGESRQIPIYALAGPIRYRLRTQAWETDADRMRGMAPAALEPLLASSVLGVREGALRALHHV